MLDEALQLYAIDAAAVAQAAGLAGRINTVMQTCFFALSGVLPTDEAIAKLKDAIAHRRTASAAMLVVERNIAAVDTTLAHLHQVPIGAAGDRDRASPPDRGRRRAPTSCSASPPGCSPARATCCR